MAELAVSTSIKTASTSHTVGLTSPLLAEQQAVTHTEIRPLTRTLHSLTHGATQTEC